MGRWSPVRAIAELPRGPPIVAIDISDARPSRTVVFRENSRVEIVDAYGVICAKGGLPTSLRGYQVDSAAMFQATSALLLVRAPGSSGDGGHVPSLSNAVSIVQVDLRGLFQAC